VLSDWLEFAHQHFVFSLTFLVVLLYFLRRELLAVCDNTLKPLSHSLVAWGILARRASGSRWHEGLRGWRALALFSTRGDASSRLIAGCAGAAMVALSIYLSSELLDAPLHLLSDKLAPQPKTMLDLRALLPIGGEAVSNRELGTLIAALRSHTRVSLA